MELTGRVRILSDGGFGVWRIEAKPADLQFIGEPLSRSSGRSVIGLSDCAIADEGRSLVFPIGKATVLVLGNCEESVAISTKEDRLAKQETASASQEEKHLPDFVRRSRTGDNAFIAACRSELLPQKVVELGQEFLNRIREFSDDELREGMHRKWVTYPRNFLALTIQNRNKQFCVHVKKSSVLGALADVLDIRDDRPGYVRFWLQDESQLDAAVRAARGSYGV